MTRDEAIYLISEFMVIDDWSLVYMPNLHDALEVAIEAMKELPEPSGYKLVKRPDYDCCCHLDYPNKNYCHKNGHWKCVDDYEYIGKSKQHLTHCRRKKNE